MLTVQTQATWLDEVQGRPPVQVWGTGGVVSSMHPEASRIGADILRGGGTAVDAAVAVGAAISVLSHDWAGPAGDSAWLLYLARTGEYRYLDGYSTCPQSVSAERIARHFGLRPDASPRAFQEEPADVRHLGIATGMVPGTPSAWCELMRCYGTRSLRDVLDPAIALAEGGFAVNRYLAQAVAANLPKLAAFPATRRIWLEAGQAPTGEGALLKQADLGATLRRIASDGREGFYGGDTAAAIVAHCASQGGFISASDLSGYRCVWREVLRTRYRGVDVVTTSPPTAGIHLVQALNILDGYALDALPYHGTEALHLMLEALKLALADRRAIGGDPDFTRVDLERLASRRYAAEMRSKIELGRASQRGSDHLSGASTTHFVVADKQGDMVSVTQTIGSRFGSGDTVPGTGLLMNDRTWWMSLGRGANQVAPRHRANIGHAPAILVRDGDPYSALGSPGGFGIVQYLVQVISGMIDHGLDIQAAIEAPRFKLEDLSGPIGVERRMSAETIDALRSLGHRIVEYPAWTDAVGGIEGVERRLVSSMLAGYDPRRNSMACGVNQVSKSSLRDH